MHARTSLRRGILNPGRRLLMKPICIRLRCLLLLAARLPPVRASMSHVPHPHNCLDLVRGALARGVRSQKAAGLGGVASSASGSGPPRCCRSACSASASAPSPPPLPPLPAQRTALSPMRCVRPQLLRCMSVNVAGGSVALPDQCHDVGQRGLFEREPCLLLLHGNSCTGS